MTFKRGIKSGLSFRLDVETKSPITRFDTESTMV